MKVAKWYEKSPQFFLLDDNNVPNFLFFWKLQHRLEIAEIALDQVGHQTQRKLAYVDKNRDLFLTNLGFRSSSKSIKQAPGKLGSMVLSLNWNTEANMLTALQVKFIYSEKARKIWKNIPIFLVLLQCQRKLEDFFKLLWPSQNIWTLKISNF